MKRLILAIVLSAFACRGVAEETKSAPQDEPIQPQRTDGTFKVVYPASEASPSRLDSRKQAEEPVEEDGEIDVETPLGKVDYVVRKLREIQESVDGFDSKAIKGIDGKLDDLLDYASSPAEKIDLTPITESVANVDKKIDATASRLEEIEKIAKTFETEESAKKRDEENAARDKASFDAFKDFLDDYEESVKKLDAISDKLNEKKDDGGDVFAKIGAATSAFNALAFVVFAVVSFFNKLNEKKEKYLKEAVAAATASKRTTRKNNQ